MQETHCHGLFLSITTELELVNARGFRTAINLRMIFAKLKVDAAIARESCREEMRPQR